MRFLLSLTVLCTALAIAAGASRSNRNYRQPTRSRSSTRSFRSSRALRTYRSPYYESSSYRSSYYRSPSYYGSYYNASSSGGDQTGHIVGSIFAVIVAFGVFCTVCYCCDKKKGKSDRVVHPTTAPHNPDVAVVSSGTSAKTASKPYLRTPHRTQSMGGMPPQPPQYNTLDALPACDYSDPAYSPGENDNFPPNPSTPIAAAAADSARQTGGNDTEET
ncbi:uncharacterized protein [Littorina saxatilis]|uniref:uncharacterized protein n=1 Tax=Littorina saxatilis TaxID=31220 RepID=UPI0038B5FC42